MGLGKFIQNVFGGGSRPSQSDYQPSASDKASASVAKAEFDYFKRRYDPLLRKERDAAASDDIVKTARARANADTAQALTQQPSFAQTQSIDATGNMADAFTGQLSQATTQAKQFQNQRQGDVLATARGQSSTAQQGMSQIGRIETSEALNRAKNSMLEDRAKYKAIGQVSTALGAQGVSNMNSGEGGTFFTPVDAQGNQVQGVGNRLGYTDTYYTDEYRRNNPNKFKRRS